MTSRLPESQLEGILSISGGRRWGGGGTFLWDNLDWNHLLASTLEKILATKMAMLPHRSRVVTEYLQQDDITEMDQPAQSPDYNPIEHMWNELEVQSTTSIICHITSMKSTRPCWNSLPISQRSSCSVWWPPGPGD